MLVLDHKTEEPIMATVTLGIDFGKNLCSMAGLDGTGAVVLRHRIRRFRLFDFPRELLSCTVTVEACGGAHHVGRFCEALGHRVGLMPPM